MINTLFLETELEQAFYHKEAQKFNQHSNMKRVDSV